MCMPKRRKAQPADIRPLPKIRFDALAGYARSPRIVLIIEEREWYIRRLRDRRRGHVIGWNPCVRVVD
jgi:hypothetical protein